ncbi:hypothetical protein EI982_06435 [Haloplanus rallus]|uniref:Uncharacterized protein n=1 Tax=Haloplanus rallus TaxID=1816183 RepID=A0A6B9FDD8_9EURY|nr:hypothetical protein [Haloplanus rallus]QGX94450.1 hypothetical protein EI982_06435 [Haloplanus rallus]
MSRNDDEVAGETEELAVLLADLERTLADLRSAVEDDVRDGGREGRNEGVTPPRRPPTPGEILRFTEQYTIPTLVALLEATVQSLELLRAVLRLAGPRPTEERLRTRLRSPESPDAATLRETLADLRAALTGADLPEESAAGSVIADARSLTTEIDDRLASIEEEPDAERERQDRSESATDERGVAIDVREGNGDDTADGSTDVDVDAELASIKESLEDDGADDEE